MLTFVYVTKDCEVYPPHGIRVANFDTWDELSADVLEFLGEAEVPGVQLQPLEDALQKKDLKEVERQFDMLLSGSWSLYSDGDGYLCG